MHLTQITVKTFCSTPISVEVKYYWVIGLVMLRRISDKIFTLFSTSFNNLVQIILLQTNWKILNCLGILINSSWIIVFIWWWIHGASSKDTGNQQKSEWGKDAFHLIIKKCVCSKFIFSNRLFDQNLSLFDQSLVSKIFDCHLIRYSVPRQYVMRINLHQVNS